MLQAQERVYWLLIHLVYIPSKSFGVQFMWRDTSVSINLNLSLFVFDGNYLERNASSAGIVALTRDRLTTNYSVSSHLHTWYIRWRIPNVGKLFITSYCKVSFIFNIIMMIIFLIYFNSLAQKKKKKSQGVIIIGVPILP